MSNNLNNTGRPADDRINVNKRDEMDYWTRELKVPAQTLMNAVETVGPRVKDVKEWLKNHGHIS